MPISELINWLLFVFIRPLLLISIWGYRACDLGSNHNDPRLDPKLEDTSVQFPYLTGFLFSQLMRTTTNRGPPVLPTFTSKYHANFENQCVL